MREIKDNVTLRLPKRVADAINAVAKLAGCKPETVIRIALARETYALQKASEGRK